MEIPGIPAPVLTALGAVRTGRVALVGGAVRDLLLHRVHNDPWLGVPDLDLVAEGPASALVEALVAQLGPEVVQRCQEHGAYGTVELELNLAGELVLLDVARARRETYPVPAENPQVSFGGLADDLARRDFSINAMALELASGHLLDPHGGQRDLEQRQLRFLHDGSVRDDPTRLVRGARYAARLGLELEPGSVDQARSALAVWPWGWRPGDPPGQAPAALGTRLRMELELLLEREPWLAALTVLQGWGALALLDPVLQADGAWPRRLRWAQRLGLPLLVALVAGARDPLALAERLQLPHRQHRLLVHWLELRRRIGEQPQVCNLTVEQWCALLEAPGCGVEAVALALACDTGPRRPLLRWWLRWRHLKSEQAAADLLASGMGQGPELGQRLRDLRAERLRRERL
ncbi:CCA tRNA nucleotidyltransferase [Cyanobium sp. FACHB-13342]|uniref:CCA tRNA nucleotidyltransferase n=1 Tax=Cyanobium sp. FACHB-13342 TaxID=2692793 RepID=UPI0016819F74|nr:CCA tRNA nucleotidyltransferase [Cyanobium sp. FACHB-13342]